MTDGLQADTYDQFCEALERVGTLLGYSASRPRYQAATDCGWRGDFGNQKELITFEAKIEHTAHVTIVPADVGQAHNQFGRAQAEYGDHGYVVRGTGGHSFGCARSGRRGVGRRHPDHSSKHAR